MEFLQEWGYLGLFIGTFLSATIIPFSSDFLIIGLLLSGSNPIISLIVATIGNWLGGLLSFWIGWLGKWEWMEKYFKIKKERIEAHKEKIDKYGAILALLSWAPFIGDVFAIGLGFYKTNFTKSAIYMLLGKGLRFTFWIIIFYFFKDFITFL